MTTTNSLYRRFGALALPAPETGETTLASLDPARDILLALLAAALTAELGPRWTDAAAGTPLDGTVPVGSTLAHEPSLDTIREVKLKLPVLCVYRTGEATLTQHTLWRRRWSQDWAVDYILGPHDVGAERKMADVLVAAAKVIDLTIEQGGHRAYRTDREGEVGAQQALVLGPGDATAYFSAITVRSVQAGPAAFAADSPRYWALSVKLLGIELDDDVEGTDAPLDGVTVRVASGGADGTVDLVTADTAQPIP